MADEQELIAQAAAGDGTAFARLVRQYQNRIFGFIMRMTANREAARDLTQDTFLAAYRNLDSFRAEAAFSTWLFQIASNKTKNYLKKSAREVPLAEGYDEESKAAGPDKMLEAKENQKKLMAALGDLPDRQRTAFNLRFFDALKFEEVARVMGISVSAAKTNFSEALKKLKARLA